MIDFFLGAFGEGKGENMITGVPFVAADETLGVRNFVSRVHSFHGPSTGVSHYVFSHYNALMALKGGLEQSGEISREAAVAGLKNLKFQVATGEAHINPTDHHISLQMYIARTEKGSLRVVEPLGVIDPKSGCNSL